MHKDIVYNIEACDVLNYLSPCKYLQKYRYELNKNLQVSDLREIQLQDCSIMSVY